MPTLWTTSDFKRLQLHNTLIVTFEFTVAAHGFMIMSCAARGVKKVGQHCLKAWEELRAWNIAETKNDIPFPLYSSVQTMHVNI